MASRKTHEQFVADVLNLFGTDFEVRGCYKNSKKHIEIHHKVCGETFSKTPNGFLRSDGCPICNNRQRTPEQFEKKVKELVGDEYTVLTQYKKAHEKVTIRHNICGESHAYRANDFLHGTRCPGCARRKRSEEKSKTHEEFVREVHDVAGDEYTVLGTYDKSHKALLMRHNICGTEYNAIPSSFVAKGTARCPRCWKHPAKRTQIQFEQEVFELVGDEYEVLGEYTNTNTHVLMRHNKCGREYHVVPKCFLSGQRCWDCFVVGMTKTHESFVKEVYAAVGDEYTVIGKYAGSLRPVEIFHKDCGKTFHAKAIIFLKGSNCPHCNSSKGEKAIGRYLKRVGLENEPQYGFEGCVDKHKLPFDFAVFEKGRVVALIEYDGKQHFEPISLFGGEEGFRGTQRRDAIKNEYCKQRGIPLLRIPYWDFDNIEERISDFFAEQQLFQQPEQLSLF